MDKPSKCNIHARSLNGHCQYADDWCEGYCGGRTDAEPIDKCKECKFYTGEGK